MCDEEAVMLRFRWTATGISAGVILLTGLTMPLPQAPHAAQPTIQALLDSPGRDLPFDPALAAVSCPSERGPVKEGADADRNKVSTSITKVSITYLRGRAKPASYPKDKRVTSTELHTYQVTATLTQFKEESDGDFHLVIKDSSGHSMIAEVPYSSCVPKTSRWRSAIITARSTFTKTYRVTTSWKHVKRSITLRGIGYLDPLHGQTGVAPNGVELHPVIYMHFN
jgi:hypothetical protein